MIAVIDCGSSKVPEIVRCVQNAGKEVSTFKLLELTEANFDSVSRFIVSGAPILLSQVDATDYLGQFRVILAQKKPVLGICFGHQLLSMSHGGRVYLDTEVRRDIPIRLRRTSPLFQGFEKELIMNQDHTESCTVGNGFMLVANSNSCMNESMMHTDLQLFGVQSHPETSGKSGQLLIENFLRIQ